MISASIQYLIAEGPLWKLTIIVVGGTTTVIAVIFWVFSPSAHWPQGGPFTRHCSYSQNPLYFFFQRTTSYSLTSLEIRGSGVTISILSNKKNVLHSLKQNI